MRARESEYNQPAIYDQNAEQAVAVSTVIKPDILVQLGMKVQPEDFFSDSARHIYLAAQSIYHDDLEAAKGKEIKTGRIPLVRLIDRLSSMGALASGENGLTMRAVVDMVGNPMYMPEAVDAYADIVREYSLRRKIYELAYALESKALDKTLQPHLETPNIIRRLQESLNWFSGSAVGKIYRSHRDSVDTYFERLNSVTEARKIRAAGNQRRMPYTGLDCLDGVVDPRTRKHEGRKVLLKAGSLVTILADTSVGKSLLADQIAVHNAQLGLKVLFFVNELSIDDMVDRRASRFARIDVRRIVEHRLVGGILSEGELKAITEAHQANMAAWKGGVHFVQAATMSGEQIVQHAVSLNNLERDTTGRGFDLVIVDYIQKVSRSKGVGESRVEVVGDNTTRMSEMALMMDIPVLLTSQVSGSREQGADREVKVKPGVHSGKDSSRIEEASQVLLGLWRQTPMPSEKNLPQPATLSILKNTFGHVGEECPVMFMPGEFKFKG